ncbi:ABC transporter substrate-binding protein [uncultured Sphaerochaeta sp.]|uniref:ABC transporter substrate-binding protein n=1 Tax=uncultured Sphaerochaeta sp. TaxID=886478 RepID=UPI002A0A8982|nr:ABC transporter substrate-binding protein [uncultured Sphaerochaeta sp.]
MKKVVGFLTIALVALTVASAQPMYEQRLANEPVQANIAVMAGPTGFSSVALSFDEGKINDSVVANLTVYPSPNEVIARLANGELDFACLPTNVAANMYNKGVKVKIAAVVGNGMLSVLCSDGSVSDYTGLLGKSVNIPDVGSTPDQLAKLLLMKAGLEAGKDVVLDYSVASPIQIAQMLIAGKISLAMLPQPFVSMVMAKNPKIKIVADIQELYSKVAGVDNYPMSVFVVTDKFVQAYPLATQSILDAYKASVAWVNANPAEAGQAIEKIGIMKAALATPAIPYCNLVYVSSQEAKPQVQAYFKSLYSFSPASIGGSMPSDDLYL